MTLNEHDSLLHCTIFICVVTKRVRSMLTRKLELFHRWRSCLINGTERRPVGRRSGGRACAVGIGVAAGRQCADGSERPVACIRIDTELLPQAGWRAGNTRATLPTTGEPEFEHVATSLLYKRGRPQGQLAARFRNSTDWIRLPHARREADVREEGTIESNRRVIDKATSLRSQRRWR